MEGTNTQINNEQYEGLPTQTGTTNVCLVSGSNGSHMNAAVIGSNPKFTVNLFTRRPEIFGSEVVAVSREGEEVWKGQIKLASADPQEACNGCQVFLISSPANVQEFLLKQMKPYLPNGAIIGSIFGQGNFELIAKKALGEDFTSKNMTIFSLYNIPYTCGASEQGRKVRIQGQSNKTKFCCTPKSSTPVIQNLCEQLWRMPSEPLDNFIEILLAPANQILHPGRVMGLYENGEIFPMEKLPIFYEEINQTSADNIEKLSNEIQLIKAEILKRHPELCLDAVLPVDEWVCSQYEEQVGDKSSVKRVFATNKAYGTFGMPAKTVDGKLYVNFESRILTEDIPFGLCILKDIAEMMELDVPFMTQTIEWAQKQINRKYVVDGKLNEAEIENTGTCRRFGFQKIEDLVKYYTS